MDDDFTLNDQQLDALASEHKLARQRADADWQLIANRDGVRAADAARGAAISRALDDLRSKLVRLGATDRALEVEFMRVIALATEDGSGPLPRLQ